MSTVQSKDQKELLTDFTLDNKIKQELQFKLCKLTLGVIINYL